MPDRVAPSKLVPSPDGPSRKDGVTMALCALCRESEQLSSLSRGLVMQDGTMREALVHGRCLHEWYMVYSQMPDVTVL